MLSEGIAAGIFLEPLLADAVEVYAATEFNYGKTSTPSRINNKVGRAVVVIERKLMQLSHSTRLHQCTSIEG